MLKYVTTLKLEHTITDETQIPKLSSMTDTQRQQMFDTLAKFMIEDMLTKANENGTYAFLNLVRE